jgi:pyrroloquinoline quinone biosynthesis protein E
MIANPEIVDLGDARQLSAMWNGPKLQAFRRAHLQGNIPPECRSCYRHLGHRDAAHAR